MANYPDPTQPYFAEGIKIYKLNAAGDKLYVGSTSSNCVGAEQRAREYAEWSNKQHQLNSDFEHKFTRG